MDIKIRRPRRMLTSLSVLGGGSEVGTRSRRRPAAIAFPWMAAALLIRDAWQFPRD